MVTVFMRRLIILFCLLSTISLQAQNVTIIDSSHYSSVFGEVRNFRVFLPPEYEKNQKARYPVIYFFHGWSQRYFGITRGDGYDTGDQNDGDTIAKFVANHDVIVVKWDGFNLREGDEYNLRPYNIGPVETHRQFPLYFPELVRFIDSNYRTVPDREHRAVSGLSMGGFMAFWVGGKYPDLVCAAGNFCGSPEFVNGPKEFPAEYRHIDMYKNYGGMKIRLNYGDEDFIRAYHRDMNRIFPYIMDNYEFGIYKAAHSSCGLGEMFTFILNTFENPPKKPEKWHHIDVYPDFSVWGYDVYSDRNLPGFTILENVNDRGFRSSVREFLPDGELMPYVTMSVTTNPIYGKEAEYVINDINLTTQESRRYRTRSDTEGRLKITVDGYLHDIGINEAGDAPNLSVGSFKVENMPWAAPMKKVDILVSIANKGDSKADGVKVELLTTHENVKVISAKSNPGSIDRNEIVKLRIPFTFYVEADSIDVARFKLRITYDREREWVDFIEVPIRADKPAFTNIKIADGLEYTVALAGTTKTSQIMGIGNGDGIANPGESIVVLVKEPGEDFYRQTGLYTSDAYVNPNGIHHRMSNNWAMYDHVGASEKISVPVISSNCPEHYTIEFFAEYWLPDYPDHIINRGKASVTVKGTDTKPPQIQWVSVHGNNVLEAKVFDGGAIDFVTAKLRYKKSNFTDYPHEDFSISLNDDGIDGDRIKGDFVFSIRIPDQQFGLFTAGIEAGDAFGNKGMKDFPDVFYVH